MKQKNESKRVYLDRLLAKILVRVMIGIGGLAVLLLFVAWFIEYRPQHIKFAYAPSSNGWDYTEYATRYTSDGHYWIVRYSDFCEDECDEWLNGLDAYVNDLDVNWYMASQGGSIENFCKRYLGDISNNFTLLQSYSGSGAYFYSRICIATEYLPDSNKTFISVITVHTSLITNMMLSS